MWLPSSTPTDFRLLSGADMLGDYFKSGEWGEGHHRFCKICGIATHGHVRIKQMGGDPHVSVHLAALDDLPVEELVGAKVTYMDGLHDNWWNPPTETQHL